MNHLLLALLLTGPGPRPAVALVTRVVGTAQVDGSPVTGFAWLREGASLSLPEGKNSLTLVFASGRRFELSGPASLTLAASGPTRTSGQVAEVGALPPLPPLAPVVTGEDFSPRAAAVRLRGQRIVGLRPGGGWLARADAVRLQFTPLAQVATYRVYVEDEEGEIVYQAQVSGAEAAVPPGTLLPGKRYVWRVRTAPGSGADGLGTAEFGTLGAAEAESRARLRTAATGDDAASALLLAEVDRQLGLLGDAHQTLLGARDSHPGDAELAAALERIVALMAEPAEAR